MKRHAKDFLDLTGAKVLQNPESLKQGTRGKRKPQTKQKSGHSYSPGDLVAEFQIHARAVPWKAPMVGRHGSYSPKVLTAWKKRVRDEATQAMGGRLPHSGQFRTEISFWFLPATNGSNPDLTNVEKSTEDGMQGVVFTNDRNLVGKSNGMFLNAPSDWVCIRVYAC